MSNDPCGCVYGGECTYAHPKIDPSKPTYAELEAREAALGGAIHELLSQNMRIDLKEHRPVLSELFSDASPRARQLLAMEQMVGKLDYGEDCPACDHNLSLKERTSQTEGKAK